MECLGNSAKGLTRTVLYIFVFYVLNRNEDVCSCFIEKWLFPKPADVSRHYRKSAQRFVKKWNAQFNQLKYLILQVTLQVRYYCHFLCTVHLQNVVRIAPESANFKKGKANLYMGLSAPLICFTAGYLSSLLLALPNMTITTIRVKCQPLPSSWYAFALALHRPRIFIALGKVFT